MTCTELYVITVDCVAKIIRRDVIYLKKRDFFTVLAVGVAAAAAVQILHRWFRRDPEDDYDDYEDEILEDEALEDEALGDMMSQSYDEGFADGLNADYRGSNIAAQALQAEVEELLHIHDVPGSISSTTPISHLPPPPILSLVCAM